MSVDMRHVKKVTWRKNLKMPQKFSLRLNTSTLGRDLDGEVCCKLSSFVNGLSHVIHVNKAYCLVCIDCLIVIQSVNSVICSEALSLHKCSVAVYSSASHCKIYLILNTICFLVFFLFFLPALLVNNSLAAASWQTILSSACMVD
jgi:hypothetical protein